MKRATLFLMLFMSALGSVSGQGCDEELSKSITKGLDKASEPRISMKERYDILRGLIEDNEDCLKCRKMLAEVSFERAERSPSVSYAGAARLYQEIADRCPTYHADVYYYLGVINYSLENWTDSKDAFQKFLDFDVSDASKLSRGHERRTMDVENILVEVKNKSDLFDNPIDFVPERVEGVSATADEYLPMLSPDNELMFYTRKMVKQGRGIVDASIEIESFTMSSRANISSAFDGGEALKRPFNVGDNYGGATMSVDNKEMFITACRPGKMGYNNCDIFRTTYDRVTDANGKVSYRWSELENLGPEVNTSDGWEAQPSLSSDGNILYFATARANTTPDENGNPSIDIYYSQRGADGSWGEARPLGPTINTPANEKSPFMHGDSRTLYFAANGYTGVGGYDIFFSKLGDNGRWTAPKNVGVPINTEGDEHGLIVATDGSKAYYASSKIQGSKGFDIYAFVLPEQARPEKVVLVRGTVTDDSGEVVQDASIELNYLESKKVSKIDVDQDDGSYAAIVNVQREPVVMTIESDEHAFNAQLLDEAKADQGLLVETEVTLEKVSIGTPYAINDINYATASADIDSGSKAVLQVFGKYISENGLSIAIYGHTDNVGRPDENMTLSTERAFEVMKFLQENGVSAESMTFKGFGQSDPIADNSTAQGRAKNRRTEFVITAK